MPELLSLSGPVLTPTARVRTTPFWPGVLAAGAKGASVYNHMLFPTVFESLEDDYLHLKEHVQLWDVACERQIEIIGPDAERLIKMLAPRPIDSLQIGQCLYVPAVERQGRILNDPVLLKLNENHFWLSVADSDLIQFTLGLASAADLRITIQEPDVSPLAVQGPKAAQLMDKVFGNGVGDLRFFRFGWFDFCGDQYLISRSGYSKQRGFEIYVHGSEKGIPLWNALMEAGEDLCVRAGCPNYIERIEGGLLSYGGDMTLDNTPYQCGLESYCDIEAAHECLGRDAMMREAETGIARQIRCLVIEGDRISPCDRVWPLTKAGQYAGRVTAAAWSPGFAKNIAIGMIESPFLHAGTDLEVHFPNESRRATVRESFLT